MLCGPEIDDTVRRLTTTYSSRGQVLTLTSHSAISGLGDEVNQVEMAYNDFGQLVTDYQAHAGTVDTANSLKVEYGYAPGSDGSGETNQIRPTGITYPSGRQLDYNYGSTGSGTDLFNRVHAVRDGSTNLVQYKYLGGGRIVVADYTEPDLKLDLWGDTPGSYTGLDNFGRVVDQRWVDYAGSPVDAARFEYGYDRDSVPSYRKDTVAHALGAGFDELYGRDGLRRLNDYQRGQLNGTNDAISGGTLTFGQDWSLDQVANQTALNQDSSGGGTDDLVQTRSHNTVNEITGITNTTGGAWSTPAYDAAGNTTRTPYPNNPTAAGEDVVLAYDAWNRVVKLTDAASPAATRNAYTYDARGFRIGNTLLSGDQLDHYYTAGWQCVEDHKDGTLDMQYVWGLRYIDDLVQRQRDTTGNGVLDETTYALTDTQFNVVALSDTSGNIVQRISYQPYGQPVFLTASYAASTNTRDWRYLFQGLRRHYGLYDNRMRLYDLLTGRFMQRDPLGYPDGLNAYAAYHVMWGGVDPMGMQQYRVEYDRTENNRGGGRATGKLLAILDVDTNECEGDSRDNCIGKVKVTLVVRYQDIPINADGRAARDELNSGRWRVVSNDTSKVDDFLFLPAKRTRTGYTPHKNDYAEAVFKDVWTIPCKGGSESDTFYILTRNQVVQRQRDLKQGKPPAQINDRYEINASVRIVCCGKVEAIDFVRSDKISGFEAISVPGVDLNIKPINIPGFGATAYPLTETFNNTREEG